MGFTLLRILVGLVAFILVVLWIFYFGFGIAP